MRKKSFLPLAPLGLAVLALFACAKPAPMIGFVGPLTGPSSAVGVGARNGFNMALGSGPEAAAGDIGSPVLLIEDDQNDADQGLAAVQRLAAAGCRLVILATTSQAASKAIPWCMQAGVLVLSPTVSNPLFSGADDLFFRINSSSGSYGEKLADVAYGRYGKRGVGIVGDDGNSLYVDAVVAAFRAEFAAQGGSVPFDLRFKSTDGIPETELLAALADSGADGLLVVTASTEAALIAKALEKNGRSVGLFLPPWPLTVDLLQNGGRAIDGAVAVSASDMEYRTEGGLAFRKNYLAAYGEEPSFTAMFGYEAAAVLRRALAAAPSADPAALKAKILAIADFPGLQGDIRFDAMGDANRTLFLFVVEDGDFKSLAP
jgi:branched-chain amino acid transport system substrate-binding protein